MKSLDEEIGEFLRQRGYCGQTIKQAQERVAICRERVQSLDAALDVASAELESAEDALAATREAKELGL